MRPWQVERHAEVLIHEDGLRQDKGYGSHTCARKGQAESFYFGHPLGEVRLVSRVFQI